MSIRNRFLPEKKPLDFFGWNPSMFRNVCKKKNLIIFSTVSVTDILLPLPTTILSIQTKPIQTIEFLANGFRCSSMGGATCCCHGNGPRCEVATSTGWCCVTWSDVDSWRSTDRYGWESMLSGRTQSSRGKYRSAEIFTTLVIMNFKYACQDIHIDGLRGPRAQTIQVWTGKFYRAMIKTKKSLGTKRLSQ